MQRLLLLPSLRLLLDRLPPTSPQRVTYNQFRMKLRSLHSWDLGYASAKEVQLALAPLVCQCNHVLEAPRFIAGVDISGSGAAGEALGAVVVVSYPI